LPAGSRLEARATYINLRHPNVEEFTAKGEENVSEQDWIVPKSEVDYELWNLIAGKGEHSLQQNDGAKTERAAGEGDSDRRNISPKGS
jgi:hypothetical protein